MISYNTGKLITEAKQHEDTQRYWQHNLAQAAIQCCKATSQSIMDKLKAVFNFQATVCCIDEVCC